MDEVTITIIEQPISVTIIATEGTEVVITKSQVEGVLTGDITSHNHDTQLNEALALFGSIAPYNAWFGTQAEYDALGVYDNGTLYFTTE